MILYNVTVNVDNQIEKDWLDWMKNEHLPEIMSTGMFSEHRIFKLLFEEQQGVTYAFQFFANSIENILEFQEKHLQRLEKKVIARYGENTMAFRTLLEEID